MPRLLPGLPADRTLEVSEGAVDSLGPSAVHHEGGTKGVGATQLPTHLPEPDPAPGPAQEPRVDIGVRVIASPLPQLQARPAWAPGAGIYLGGRGEGRVIHGFHVYFRPTGGISARRGF